MTPTQHIRKVEAAAVRLDKARLDFHAAIRDAIAGGCSVRAVAAVSGLGKSRIHDIAVRHPRAVPRDEVDRTFARAFASQGGVSPNREVAPQPIDEITAKRMKKKVDAR